jgi:hypothetical protein
MARISFQVSVEQDADDAFKLIADAARRAAYEVGVVTAERIGDGPLGPGARFRVVRRTPAGRAKLTTEIVELDPEERILVERVVEGPMRGSISRWRIRQAGWKARIGIAWEPQLSGRLALAAPLVERRLRRDIERTCANLEKKLRARR